MLKQIKEYFKKCPLLEGSKINVNYLAEKALSYSIEAEPGERTIKNYVDGGELRQKVFLFASREEFDYDPKGNEDIAKFYEELSAWIDENNKKRILPKLDKKYEPFEIKISSGEYLMSEDGKTARFQMQLKLIYKID